MRVEDLVGKKFAFLKPLERVGSDNFGRAKWLCQCKCGNQKVVASHNLKYGLVASCGCLRRQARPTNYH